MIPYNISLIVSTFYPPTAERLLIYMLLCLGYSENLFDSVMKSHRLVIFLTLEFIKDDWSMLALNKVLLIIIKLV